jgi:histidinol phosphatase-like PHP family hydrolase
MLPARLPARKDLQYEIVQLYTKSDVRIRLNTTAQARKKFDDLPEHIEARLVTKVIKEIHIGTSPQWLT